MEAKSLRIGNYVYWNHKGVPYNDYMWTHEVEIIEKDEIWTKAGYTSIDKIEPITLTEDWLLRFGFEINESGFYIIDTGRKALSISHKEGFHTTFRIDVGMDFCEIIESIQYVNQLQNLYYALICEELTIKTE